MCVCTYVCVCVCVYPLSGYLFAVGILRASVTVRAIPAVVCPTTSRVSHAGQVKREKPD